MPVGVPALLYAEATGPVGEPSSAVAARVAGASERQAARRDEAGALTNARLEPAAVRRLAALDVAGDRLLAAAGERFLLSGRGVDRLLRGARTIADLEEKAKVEARHVAGAPPLKPC